MRGCELHPRFADHDYTVHEMSQDTLTAFAPLVSLWPAALSFFEALHWPACQRHAAPWWRGAGLRRRWNVAPVPTNAACLSPRKGAVDLIAARRVWRRQGLGFVISDVATGRVARRSSIGGLASAAQA